jgi:hypothetical protein
VVWYRCLLGPLPCKALPPLTNHSLGVVDSIKANEISLAFFPPMLSGAPIV